MMRFRASPVRSIVDCFRASSRLGLTLLLGLAACSSDSGQATSEIPTIIPEMDLRIDGYKHDLVPITWLGVSPNGQIALIQGQDHSVRFFDVSGEPLGSVGREGEGPGEFRRPLRGGWVGDTLWVSDPQLSRVTMISPTLEVLTAFTTPPIARPRPPDAATLAEYSSPMPYGVLNRDTLVVTGLMRVDRQPMDPTVGFPLLRITGSGEIIHLISQIPVDEGLSVTIKVGDGIAFMPVPFFPRSEWVLSPDGERMAVLTTDMSNLDAPSYRVRAFDSLGQLVVDHTESFVPVPIAPEKLDSAIEATSTRRPEIRIELEAALREAARTIYPEAERLILGSDGRIWIGMRVTEEGRRWLVLDADGSPRERVLVPGNVILRAASATHLWAVERDQFDVESVVRYQLR